MNVHAPQFKWELNPNSIALVGIVIGMLVGWGYLYAELVQGTSSASSEIGKLWAKISVLEANNSRIENLEYRTTTVEGIAREGIVANRETASTLVELAADMKVTKEILQRIEAQGGRRTRF